jgi:two-component system, NarL family, sensor kinase
MKMLCVLLPVLLNALPLTPQLRLDSLQTVLRQTTITKNSLLLYLNRIETMDPNEMESIRLIGEWVIQNAAADSLRETEAAAHLTLGKIYTSVLLFEEATCYLTTALNIAEKNNFPAVRAGALNTIGYIYQRNEQYEKAVEYYQSALASSNTARYQEGIALANYNLGSIALLQSQKNKIKQAAAVQQVQNAYKIITAQKDTQQMIAFSSGLVNAYLALQQFDAAWKILQKTETLIQATGKKVAYIRHYNRVGKIYNHIKKYDEAIRYYHTGLELTRQYHIPRWFCMYYTDLAETYENMGNYKKANWYNQLNIQMHDALVSKENFIAAADIQNQYERAKKDNQILKLAAINKHQTTLNRIFIGATLALALISFLGYGNFKHRQKIARQQQELQQQQIAELEKDKHLLAIDAMLKGQEEERSRIAKDLHDGLGGLLSGTKLSFLNVKENLLLTKENAALFDKSLSMLDTTIGDLRKVAHNLMPETLIRFGLYDSLRDFCSSIQLSSGKKVVYQQLGENRLLNSTAQVYSYRIIQELVNNALRHAAAQQIIVQLSINAHTIGIVVEDDGKGFDKNEIDHIRGAGINNVHSRVQYFNGMLDIITAPGKGTSVNIELKA